MISNNRPLYETLSNLCSNKKILFSNNQKIRIKNSLNLDDKRGDNFSLEKNKFLNFLKTSAVKQNNSNKKKKFLIVNSNKETFDRTSDSFSKDRLYETNISPKRKVWKSQTNFKSFLNTNDIKKTITAENNNSEKKEIKKVVFSRYPDSLKKENENKIKLEENNLLIKNDQKDIISEKDRKENESNIINNNNNFMRENNNKNNKKISKEIFSSTEECNNTSTITNNLTKSFLGNENHNPSKGKSKKSNIGKNNFTKFVLENSNSNSGIKNNFNITNANYNTSQCNNCIQKSNKKDKILKINIIKNNKILNSLDRAMSTNGNTDEIKNPILLNKINKDKEDNFKILRKLKNTEKDKENVSVNYNNIIFNNQKTENIIHERKINRSTDSSNSDKEMHVDLNILDSPEKENKIKFSKDNTSKVSKKDSKNSLMIVVNRTKSHQPEKKNEKKENIKVIHFIFY